MFIGSQNEAQIFESLGKLFFQFSIPDRAICVGRCRWGQKLAEFKVRVRLRYCGGDVDGVIKTKFR